MLIEFEESESMKMNKLRQSSLFVSFPSAFTGFYFIFLNKKKVFLSHHFCWLQYYTAHKSFCVTVSKVICYWLDVVSIVAGTLSLPLATVAVVVVVTLVVRLLILKFIKKNIVYTSKGFFRTPFVNIIIIIQFNFR
jgi:hypothetical protein